MRRTAVVLVGVLALAGCGGGGGGSRGQAAAGATTTSTTASTTTSTTPAGSAGTTGSGVAPVAPSRFLYSANYGDASITALRLDPATGAPTPFATTVLGDAPLRLAVDPTERFLYAIERGEVTPLAIGTTGGLTPIGAPVVLAGEFPMAGAVTPDGALLVTTWYGGGVGASVRTFTIGPAGGLTQAASFSLGAGAQPVDLVVDPRGRVAYVVDEAAFTITALQITPGTGALASLGAPTPSLDVRALALDASGAHLVAMTSASPGSLRAYRVGSGGGLTPVGTPLGTGPHSPMAITRAPDGSFHVVTASSSLVVVAIDAQGTLTEQSVTPVPARGFPCALAVDASGRFVYTANFAGDDLSVLRIGAAGAVTAGANVAIGPAPGGAASGSTQPSFLVSVR